MRKNNSLGVPRCDVQMAKVCENMELDDLSLALFIHSLHPPTPDPPQSSRFSLLQCICPSPPRLIRS